MISRINTIIGSAKADYIPEQRDSHHLFDDEEPLEYPAPTLKIGEVDPNFGEEAVEQMIEWSVSAKVEFRSDPASINEIPDRAEKGSIKPFCN